MQRRWTFWKSDLYKWDFRSTVKFKIEFTMDDVLSKDLGRSDEGNLNNKNLY